MGEGKADVDSKDVPSENPCSPALLCAGNLQGHWDCPMCVCLRACMSVFPAVPVGTVCAGIAMRVHG